MTAMSTTLLDGLTYTVNTWTVPVTTRVKPDIEQALATYAQEACMTLEDFVEVMILVGLQAHERNTENLAELAAS